MFQKWANYELRKLHGAVGLSILAVLFIVSQFIGVIPQSALADELSSRSLQVINPIPSVQTTYIFDFDIATAGPIGSIKFEFCENSPIYSDTCTPPPDFTAAGAILSSQSGITDFSLMNGTPTNVIVIGRNPLPVPAQPVSYVFDNITNTSAGGTSYVRVSTYSATDGTGTAIDTGGIAYTITPSLDISTEVPQYLEFCTGISIAGYNCSATTGDQANFGDLSSQAAASASSQFMAATNADFGYNIFVDGNPLTSGNNVIDPLSSVSSSRPGTNQFGLNLRANSNPSIGLDPQGPGTTSPNPTYNQPDKFFYNNGDVLASANDADSYRKFTVSYLVNISSQQPAGDYVSTMYFICLANF